MIDISIIVLFHVSSLATFREPLELRCKLSVPCTGTGACRFILPSQASSFYLI